MKNVPILKLVLATNLVALLVLVFAYPHLMVSPGPVMKAHADIATHCFACHSPWHGADANRCVLCHRVADIGLRTTKGVALRAETRAVSFHQHLLERDCIACHSDHEAPRLTQRARKAFSHALLEPGIRPRCSTCHTPPRDALHRTLSVECSQCHSDRHWKPATFEHARYFLLDSDHNAPCRTCHTTPDYRHYTCFGCHEHTPENVRAQHAEEGITNTDNCVRCHRSASDEAGEGGDGKAGERD